MRLRAALVLLALAAGLAGAAPAAAQDGTGSLAGTVTAPDGAPLAGVCVQVLGEQLLEGRTDAEGRYALEGVAAGDAIVGFNVCEEPLPGYVAEFFDDAPTLDAATPVTVTAGAQTGGIDAQLAVAATIGGRVTDEDTGAALAGICVLAVDETSGGLGLGRTAEDGAYALANLRAGEYTVAYTDCGAPFTHLSEVYDDVPLVGLEPAGEPTTVVVAEGEERTDVDAAMLEGGAVSGTVTALHNGQPLPLVCVGLYSADAADRELPEAFAVSGVTPGGEPPEAPGDFVVGGVRPGTYVAGFNPAVCGNDGYVTQFSDDENTPAAADRLTVAKGRTVEGVDAVLAPLPSISVACPGEAPGTPDSGAPDSPAPPAFSDVPESNVHATAISCLAGHGIAKGRGDGTYGPQTPVSRGQMATLVTGALRVAGVALPAEPADAFDDDQGSVHETAINQLAALGVVTGVGNRRYDPTGMVYRGQMATFLVRSYEKATGLQLRSSGDRFPDDTGNRHEESINLAATAGLAAGLGDGNFRPAIEVPRDQVATFVARLLDRLRRDLLASAAAGGDGSRDARG